MMGRHYAGILGPLAMIVVICRGWLGSGGVEGTLTLATFSLFAYALVGAFLGLIAQNTIDKSVQTKLERELNEQAPAV